MRILIVCSHLGVGGTETQIIALSRELVRLGHNVTIYSLNRSNPRASELAGSGVVIIADQKRVKLDLGVIYRLRRCIKSLKADIIHGFLYDGDLYARVAGAGSGAPVLNSERSDSYSLNLPQKLGMCLTRRLADGVIANSYAGAEFAKKLFGLPDDHVHVVSNGIALEAVDARIEACRVDYKVEFFGNANVRVACVVGTICPSKDYLLALDVACCLTETAPEWRVLIVGGTRAGMESYADKVQEHYRSEGLSERVRFAGLRQDVIEIMSQCDVLYSTSVQEGFPNVVLEAMAARTPVVSTEYSDIRRILPCEWQVAKSRRPEAIVSAILRAYETRKTLAEDQRRWVENNATVMAAAKALLAVYARYAGQASPSNELANVR
jgi:glycosyltransferase involved in cell wall biosynthesis